MDGTGEDNAKQNKASRESQLLYGFTHLWNITNRKIGRKEREEERRGKQKGE